MQRAFVFLVVGPLTVALVTALALLAAGAPGSVIQFIATALLVLTVPVTALAACVDGYLAGTFPIALRAPVTAIAGAMAGYAVAYTMLHCFFPASELMFFPLGGAVCTGVCSLLANAYGSWHRIVVSADA